MTFLLCFLFACFSVWFNDRYPETAINVAGGTIVFVLSLMVATTIQGGH